MTTANVNAAQLAGGRLFYGVTDLTAAAPYGGTELGHISSAFCVPPQGVVHLPMEEDGSSVRAIYTGGDAVAGVLLTTFDADAVAAFFPGAETGDAAGPIVKFPALVGQTAETLTMLLFAPTNVDHNAWLIPVAQPALEAQAALRFSHRTWLNFPMVFRSQADANGLALATGKLADLVSIVDP